MSELLPSTPFTRAVGIDVPLICGPMYPCSNPELVAAVSEAGGIGIVQPISLTYVYGYDFRAGLKQIRSLTDKPFGFNALIEQSSKAYHNKMVQWVDVALEEGVRFFITSLGNPKWVADRVHAAGGIVYHDVTEKKWAQKGLDGGVDGLIAVNSRAGGHTGHRTARQLFDELAPLGVPLVSAGGVGTAREFVEQLAIGYAGVQLGTRFIATPECKTSHAYKQAIVDATEADIALTERLTGVPVSVIANDYVKRLGTKAGPFARWMLQGRKTKHWMRMYYALKGLHSMKKSSQREQGAEYWQAGKSVAGIHEVKPAGAIVREFAEAWRD